MAGYTGMPIGGGVLALLTIAAVVIVAGVSCQSNGAPSTSPAAVQTPAASAAPKVSQAGAMIGGLGENNTRDPALVVCQIRGTLPGMEFHGTLSGPNIGSTVFDVKSGQPSHGVTPLSPDEAVFAIAFPGMGGQHGGGPAGPFTCTLTSVDVPSGAQLASHRPSDWTITVT